MSTSTGHAPCWANRVLAGGARDARPARPARRRRRAAPAGTRPQPCRTGTAARAAVDAADPFPAAESYRAIAAHNRGVGLLWTGDTQGALETLAEVARHDPHGDIEITRMTARGHRAMCELIEARLDSAQHTADQVLADAAVRGVDVDVLGAARALVPRPGAAPAR